MAHERPLLTTERGDLLGGVLGDERGSAGGYVALFLVVMLVTIGVLAAFRYDIEVTVVAAANYLGLSWLIPVF